MQIFKWMPLKADDSQSVAQSTASIALSSTESNVQRQSNDSLNHNCNKEISSTKTTTTKVLSEQQQVVDKSFISTYSPNNKVGDHNSNYTNEHSHLNSTGDVMSTSPVISGDESTGRKSCMDRAYHSDVDYNHSRISRSGASSISGISSAGDQPPDDRLENINQMQADVEKHESHLEAGNPDSQKRTIDLDDSHMSLSPFPAPKRVKTEEVTATTVPMEVSTIGIVSASEEGSRLLTTQSPYSTSRPLPTAQTPSSSTTPSVAKTIPQVAGSSADVHLMDTDDFQGVARQVTDQLVSAVSSTEVTG